MRNRPATAQCALAVIENCHTKVASVPKRAGKRRCVAALCGSRPRRRWYLAAKVYRYWLGWRGAALAKKQRRHWGLTLRSPPISISATLPQRARIIRKQTIRSLEQRRELASISNA